MDNKNLSEEEFNKLIKNPTEAYKMYTSLIKENNSLIVEKNSLIVEKNSLIVENNSLIVEKNSLIVENQKKEAMLIQIMNEQVYSIDKKIYDSYDLSQSDNIKMKEEIDDAESAEMLRKFKDYINKIDTISDNIGSKENHDDDVSNTEQKFLDKMEINDIIKHEFGTNLEIPEFIEAFGKAISKNVNKNWIKSDRIAFKSSLENIVDSSIKQIFYKEIPQHIMQLRMDNLLCTVLTKVYKPSAKRIDYLMTQPTLKYSLNPLEKGIKLKNPKNNAVFVFDKKYIKFQINNNVGIINSYYKLIQKFVTDKYDKNQLKEKLNEIVDNTNVYFCDLPKKVLGITICNGDIFISGKFLQEALHESPKNRNYNLTGISKIYLTLLHEYAHKLHYIIRKYINKSGDNCFVKTFYFKSENDSTFDIIQEIPLHQNSANYNVNKNDLLTKNEIEKITEYKNLHGNKTLCESGDFFDAEIYLGKKQNSVSKSISNFFLFYGCAKYNDYVCIMKSFLDKIDDPGERTTNCNYKLVEDEKVSCYFSYVRGNTYY